MDFKLTDEQAMVRDMAREFARAELLPNASNWDEEGHFPIEALRKMGEFIEVWDRPGLGVEFARDKAVKYLKEEDKGFFD